MLVNARVEQILVENGRACGVLVEKGDQTYRITAPKVISTAGLYNTFQKLLPREIATKSYYHQFASTLKPGLAGISVFIGLNASNAQLNLKVKHFLPTFDSL